MKWKLIYLATPARLKNRIEEIMDYAISLGYAPFHPFKAFPYERFEGGLIGREKTIEICKKAIEICDEFALCGISEGTLEELNYALKKRKPIKLFYEIFDLEWKNFYEKLKEKFDFPLEKIKNSELKEERKVFQ